MVYLDLTSFVYSVIVYLLLTHCSKLNEFSKVTYQIFDQVNHCAYDIGLKG